MLTRAGFFVHATVMSDSRFPAGLRMRRRLGPPAAQDLAWPLAVGLILAASLDGWSVLALIAERMF